MNIANKIMNFIKDERGSEGVEYPIIVLVTAGGGAAGMMELKDATQDQTDSMINVVTHVDVG
ncbi:MAG: hypothetical protein DWH86_03680 [Planctomycetota bacterium]|nr:MAG: hypothetical protein DWH86_03680 [Planctomycetota bacterium]